jgi:hypothetical protein
MIASGVGTVGYHYLNHNQKLYQLGEDSTLGMLTWGLGSLSGKSHRTLIALFADDLSANKAATLLEIATRWASWFWAAYSAEPFVLLCQALNAKAPHVAGATPQNPLARTEDEEKLFEQLKRDLVVGFCVAGHKLPDRTPSAFQMQFDPLHSVAPNPAIIALGSYSFWGAPNMIMRLIYGYDGNIKNNIMASGKWTGSSLDLDQVMDQSVLYHPTLPIRDAIDFVYTCIHSTIKALKFSNLFQICGGPIELAVITTDRKFRWVRHKAWDSAITDGAI